MGEHDDDRDRQHAGAYADDKAHGSFIDKTGFDGVVRTFRNAADTLEGKVTLINFRKRNVEAAVDVQGVRVISRWAGRPGLSRTTVWVHCPEADGLDILVRRRSGPGGDLEVVTNDERRSRRWMGRTTKAATKRATGYRFRLAHGRVEATRAGPERDPELLVAAIDAAAGFAAPTGKTTA